MSKIIVDHVSVYECGDIQQRVKLSVYNKEAILVIVMMSESEWSDLLVNGCSTCKTTPHIKDPHGNPY